MKAQELRKKFISFFEKQKHTEISSSSLIPHNDDTLLFANAGMNQFKEIFTGQSQPRVKKAVTIQKCVRAGGKHNDLDNVGFTARHHTFFEMLGNFSFGDYFKKEAIHLAWRFLTEELKLPEEKLYITVHYSDDEAYDIWKKDVGVPESKIFKKGDADNFWAMGDTGPCGPCSEIFYDHGESYSTPNFKPAEEQDILDDELRYVEIWNLVFMQYEKTSDGQKNLPNPSIDTGAGLERLCAIIQGKYWNYDTDLFAPIFKSIEQLTGKSYLNKTYQPSMRVVADHIRSCTMLLTDGVIPSNEGRGYVLRRIIRRAVRHLKELGASPGSFSKLIPSVFETLKDQYPQNFKNISTAEKLLELEESKFLETLDLGLKYLNESLTKDVKNNTLTGEAAFRLYDTYGFPIDLTETILREQGLNVDHTSFQEHMQKRKEDSKKSWKGKSNLSDKAYHEALAKHGKTTFISQNNDLFHSQSVLKQIIEYNEDSLALVFNQTPFYPEGGGQQGDTGKLYLNDEQAINIKDTLKPVDGLIIHLVDKSSAQELKVSDTYLLKVDYDKRQQTARNHTATHLLQSALRKILGNHVKQAGSLVTSSRLRFDFTHMEALTKKQINLVEDLVNHYIQTPTATNASEMTIDEALDKGALAMFGEKYGNRVRVLSVGDFSTELCGGTHVKNTIEIGFLKIISEGSLASGVRRIEALTSKGAIDYLRDRSNLLSQIESTLKTSNNQVISKIEELQKNYKQTLRENKSLKEKVLSKEDTQSLLKPITVNDIDILSTSLKDEVDLKKRSDNFYNNLSKGFILLTSTKTDKTLVLLRSKTMDAFDCVSIFKDALKPFNGRGGGRSDMAQGSCEKLEHQKIESLIIDRIKSFK